MEAAPHPWPALGVLLMRDGLVTKDDLEAILDEQSDNRQQRISGRRLGELLVQRGVVTQMQVSELVAEQYELPFVDLDVGDIDLSVAGLLTEDLARRFSAVAVSARQDGSYLLAIADPGTVVFSDELRRTLGGAPSFAVVGPDAIDAAIEHVYRHPGLAVAARVDEVDELGVLVSLPGSGHVAPEALVSDQPYLGSRRTTAHLWPPLGALLVREGLLTDTELEAALAQQRLSPSRRLGEILVDRGTVPASAVARLVAEQYELPFVELGQVEVDPYAAALLPEDIAQRGSALPIGYLDDGSLQVVVADPTDVLYSDELRNALGVPLSFAVASPDEIRAVIAGTRRSPADVPTAVDVDPRSDFPYASTEPDPETGLVEPEIDPADSGWYAPDDVATTELVEPPASEAILETELDGEPVETFETLEAFELADPPPLPFEATFEEVSAVDAAEPVVEDAHLDEELLAEVVEPPASQAIRETERESEAVETFELEELPPLPFEATFEEVSAVESAEPVVEDAHLDEELLAEVEEAVAIAVVPTVAETEAPVTAEDAHAVVVEEDDAPAQLDLDETIRRALSLGATTVQFAPRARGIVARARIDGVMHELATFARPAGDEAVRRLAALAGLDPDGRSPREGLVAFADDERDLDLRVGCIPTRLGLLVNVRVPRTPERPSSLRELRLPGDAEESLRHALRQPSGVVVVSGPALSGRTTTLHAALQELATPERSLASVEGPVEHLVPGVAQVEVDAGAGVTFASGLRAVFRAGADVVLVGELTDEETADVAFRGARADRVVLAAVEAPGATSTVARLRELCDARLLAETLSCLVAQRLVRRICTDCRETYYANADEIAELGRPEEESGRRLLAKGRGCDACGGSGYRGWAAVFETLPLTDELRELVREDAPTPAIREAAIDAGMSTLREAAVGLCLDGVTTVAEVRLVPLD